jgi:hypothetical protein
VCLCGRWGSNDSVVCGIVVVVSLFRVVCGVRVLLLLVAREKKHLVFCVTFFRCHLES